MKMFECDRFLLATFLACAACGGNGVKGAASVGTGGATAGIGASPAGTAAVGGISQAGTPAAGGQQAAAGSGAATTAGAAGTGLAGQAAAGQSSAGQPSSAGMSGQPASAGASGAAASGSGGQPATAGGPALPPTGTFPAITDPWMTGPYAVATLGGAGPSANATVLYPRDLGKDGLKNPIVVWDNGAGQTGLSIYGALLNHLASHGFAVYAAYSATDDGKELTDGLDWMIAQAGQSSSPFYQKLDVTKTAAMGHSQGSIATFAIAADPRLTTTIHLSGGTNPMIAQGHATLANIHDSSAFICGEEPAPGADGLTNGDTASPWCAYDFDNTNVPVFLAQIKGASHITAPGMTLGACAAWLRWKLMADTTMAVNFVGTDCTLCKRPNWMCKEKGL